MPLYDNIQEPILNKYTSYSCPTTITVYCNKDSSNRVYTVDFDDFVKNCVTNEWSADSGSKAYIVGAYDITTEQINYIHGKAILSGARDAVNSIHGKGMANSDKKIFFAHHGKGSRSSGNSKSGLLWQEGSVYWESQRISAIHAESNIYCLI